jgi:hypothetical protein
MSRLVVARRPELYAVSLLLVALSHIPLSHYAATSRGYPPRDAFWQHLAIYLPFFAVALPPLFEDWAHRPDQRRRLLAAYGCWGSFVLGVVSANVHSGVPSTGHLAGVFGVLTYCWFEVLLCGIGWSILVLPFVFCFESVARGVWDLVRQFRDGHRSNERRSPAARV